MKIGETIQGAALWASVLMLGIQTSSAAVAADTEDMLLPKRDQTVLDAVLGDLLTYAGKDSPLRSETGPPSSLLFAPQAARWPQTVEQAISRRDDTSWARLDSQHAQQIQEAGSNLVSRIGDAGSFRGFIPSDSRIQLFSEGKPVGLLDRRPICSWSPGYSQDGSIALVRLVIPWSIHHAEGTYILRRADAAWTILLRQFVYSP